LLLLLGVDLLSTIDFCVGRYGGQNWSF